MNYDIKESGERIRQLRKQNGYTQETLANVLNIDRSLLSHIEAGKRGCSVDVFIRLADLFNVSLDLLIRGKETNGLDMSDSKLLKREIADLIVSLESFKGKL